MALRGHMFVRWTVKSPLRKYMTPELCMEDAAMIFDGQRFN